MRGVGKRRHTDTQYEIENGSCRRSPARRMWWTYTRRTCKSEVLEKHTAKMASIKEARREMHMNRISSQPVSAAKKNSAAQEAVGPSCNKSGSGSRRGGGKTASRHYYAERQ